MASDDWLVPNPDWIARPVDRDARYRLAFDAIGKSPGCGCLDECRARLEWHRLVDAVLEARAQDKARMGTR